MCNTGRAGGDQSRASVGRGRPRATPTYASQNSLWSWTILHEQLQNWKQLLQIRFTSMSSPSSTLTPPHPPFPQHPAADLLAQALGLPVFASPWYMPPYPEGAVGSWKIVRGGVGLDRGYHSGACVNAGSPVLMRRNAQGGWDTWMSLSPLEVESQELAFHHAHGHTVVMGLGMGWVAANIARLPAVERVTVVERDGDVLELFDRCGVLQGLGTDAAGKVRLVHADALEWQPDAEAPAVDFLYADIWLRLAEPQALAQVQRMQSNVRAAQVYFWGQELVLGALARQIAQPGEPRWAEAVGQALRQSELPLQAAGGAAEYAAFVGKVLQAWHERGAPRA